MSFSSMRSSFGSNTNFAFGCNSMISWKRSCCSFKITKSSTWRRKPKSIKPQRRYLLTSTNLTSQRAWMSYKKPWKLASQKVRTQPRDGTGCIPWTTDRSISKMAESSAHDYPPSIPWKLCSNIKNIYKRERYPWLLNNQLQDNSLY